MAKNIFIAGSSQHSGKTLIAFGLLAAFSKRGHRVTYMKPVGQRTVQMGLDHVDEDVALIHDILRLQSPPKESNPVTIPSGYTRNFLLRGGSSSDLMAEIETSYNLVVGTGADQADICIIEGTGHAGVGTVVGLSNATVAHLLNAPTLLVTGGGIGRPIDEFALNDALLRQEHVPCLGAIVNKVQESGLSKVQPALNAWFDRNSVPLLGVVPYRPRLSRITLRQIVAETGCSVLNGAEMLDLMIDECVVGAAQPPRMLPLFKPGVLAIMPGDRYDLVLAALSSHRQSSEGYEMGVSICLTSGQLPGEDIMRLVKATRMPVLSTTTDTYTSTSIISDLVAKTHPNDKEKLVIAENLVADFVDVDRVLHLIGAA